MIKFLPFILIAFMACGCTKSIPILPELSGKWDISYCEVRINSEQTFQISHEGTKKALGTLQYQFLPNGDFSRREQDGSFTPGKWEYLADQNLLRLIYTGSDREDVMVLDKINADELILTSHEIDTRSQHNSAFNIECISRAFVLMLNYKGADKPQQTNRLKLNYIFRKENEL
jgi:hypothetical protein